jgi:hypothetical protein
MASKKGKKATKKKSKAAPARPASKPRASARARPKARPRKAVAAKKATTRAKRPSPKRKLAPAAPKRTPIKRRDAAGHLAPKYAADLLAKSGDRAVPEHSFVDEPRTGDDLAEEMGEEFVHAATSGENEAEDTLDQIVPEERGGPFVESSGGTEFASGTDASNPKGAKPEPFPTT